MSASEFYNMVAGIGDAYTAGLARYKKDQEEADAKQALGSYFDSVANPQGGLADLGRAYGLGGATPQQPQGLAALGRAIDGPSQATAKAVYDGLVQRGLSPTVAAGFVGNFQGESGFKTSAWGDNGSSYGLGQWRGDRLTALNKLALNAGVNSSDLNAQLDHVVAELKGPEARALAAANAAGSPEEAAMAIARSYERPAAWALQQSGPGRAAAARQAYNQFGQPQQQQAGAPQQLPPILSNSQPQQAMPSSAMAYTATGQPVPTDDQGRALNPDGSPTGPTAPPQGLAALDAQMPGAQPRPLPTVGADAQRYMIAQAGQSGGMPQQPMQAQPGGGLGAQALRPQIPPQQEQALRAMVLNPQTRAMGLSLLQQFTGNKLQYQTDGAGNIIALDPNGRMAPQVVYKADVKPILANADQRLLDPVSGRVIAGPSSDANTNDQKNYEAAKRGGYVGSFNDWYTASKKAGATNVSIDTKGDGKFAEAAGTGLAKRFSDILDEGDAAGNDKALVGQLQDLGKVIGTGAPAAIKGWLAERGIVIDGTVGPIQAYNAIVDKLTPAQRIPGSGATSDFDAKMFKGSLPRLINTPGGNEIIANTLTALADHKIARAQIAEQALTRDITPAEAIKQMRALPNPYERFQAYRKNGGLNDKGVRSPTQAGTPGQAATDSAPVRVTSPADIAKLPKGTRIVIPKYDASGQVIGEEIGLVP